MENGFQGKENQQVPEMTAEFVNSVTERYVELFEKVSGQTFLKDEHQNPLERIRKNVVNAL